MDKYESPELVYLNTILRSINRSELFLYKMVSAIFRGHCKQL